MAEQSGATSLFGFTGEPQGGLNDLVYLRARYYNPALGRFLTQDSLIPDVTNGQALNPYAYVYNDPINLVDPSGNIPSGRLSTGAAEGVRSFAEVGLRALNWWYDQPDNCECLQVNSFAAFVNRKLTKIPVGEQEIPVTPGYVGGVVAQAYWAYKSTPAEYIGTKVVEKYFFQSKLGWSWIKLRPTLNVERGWKVTNVSRGSYYFRPSGQFRTGLRTKVTYSMQVRPRYNKWNGFTGSAAIAGLIDGVMQAVSDSANLCLSRHQRYMRSFAATMFGFGAGAAAALTFTALIPFSLPVAIVGGFVAGSVASTGFGFAKEKMFLSNSKHFGRPLP
jgi:RHS repeat-associated protein